MIVVDDSKLCVDGLNRHAINCTNGNIHENISRIKPVTILDMDTLILISDLVKKGELDIFEQIEQYHNYIDGKHGTYSQTEKLYYSDISFSSYIMDKFEMRSPSIINDWFEELV